MIAVLLSLLAAAPAETPLRPAQAILADYANAIGGRAAWKRLRSVHIKRSLTVLGQGANGSEEHWATADGRNLSVSTLRDVGTFRQGCDGRATWSRDPVFGLRKLEGAEAEEARINGAWNAEPDLASLYVNVKSVSPPKEAQAKTDTSLECVELQRKIGKPSVLCFDAKTHLRVLQTGAQPSPGGDIPYKIVFGDWRTSRGIKTWYLEKMTAGPTTVEGRITSLVFDEKIPASQFKIPKQGSEEPKQGSQEPKQGSQEPKQTPGEVCKSVDLVEADKRIVLPRPRRLPRGTVCDPKDESNRRCTELVCLRGKIFGGGSVPGPGGISKVALETSVNGEVSYWRRGDRWHEKACHVSFEISGNMNFGNQAPNGVSFVPDDAIAERIDEELTKCLQQIRQESLEANPEGDQP